MQKRSDRKFDYDLYLVGENTWNVPCPACGKERILNKIENVRRTLRTKCECKSCAFTGKMRKPWPVEKRPNTQTWSKKVKEQWGSCCAVCSSEENLHAHHILPVVAYPELFRNVSNGVCLCQNCHNEFHNLNGKTQIK